MSGASGLQSIKISECFQTIEIRCTNAKPFDMTGIVASVEDTDGNLLLTTDSSWECSSHRESGDWSKANTYHIIRPSTTEEILQDYATPIWLSNAMYTGTVHCKHRGNLFQREGKRL